MFITGQNSTNTFNDKKNTFIKQLQITYQNWYFLIRNIYET